MQNSKQRVEQSIRSLASLGKIDARTQFGGYSLAVNKVVFAVIAEGELYLRACEQIQPYIIEGSMAPLIFNKRGMPISLAYYHVNEALWQQPEKLLLLSQGALKHAQREGKTRRLNLRVKDLPNMCVRLEMLLRQVGICSVKMLRETGARRSWLKLKAVNKNIGINTLFALEGAISGYHRAALPVAIQEELRDWFNHANNGAGKREHSELE
ncbi:competence protein TfoX [[Pantoea] beijingensis]|uniref:Competence protein TfoX n=1 Tax=[Pantoea] beijingensis TaxID=1324864 RepID=A0A443ICZ0_9GAMM|nr:MULTISPECIES: TfoX/Sxy family DNA transformation protein [Erwiniaceae]RWR01989.1 competence protein TfoX [[Pantoea] beijingensis]